MRDHRMVKVVVFLPPGIDRIAWNFWSLWWFLWGDPYGRLVYKLWKRNEIPKRWLDEVSKSPASGKSK